MQNQDTVRTVRCPNCGCEAQRYYFIGSDRLHAACPGQQIIRTECRACDYLMTICSQSGNVVEAYAPSISAATLRQKAPMRQTLPSKESWKSPFIETFSLPKVTYQVKTTQ